jgi:hypothetical protein
MLRFGDVRRASVGKTTIILPLGRKADNVNVKAQLTS